MPVSHLTLTVAHLPTSTSFFLSCLQPLGYQFIGRHDDFIGFGQKSGEPADFWITEQKPGVPAGAAHVAFPAPSKDAVGTFFINALKSGAKLHGEPKTRDADSGYYSAAIIDFDGNSIEAVYRPSHSSARSEISQPTLALLEGGSVVSKASSRASTMKTESIAPRSETKSYISKASTAVDRGSPSGASRDMQPSPTYVVHSTTTQKTDEGKTAKTIVGSLIGAAAGAALAYAITSSTSDSTETATTTSPPPQYSPREFLPQLLSASQAPSQVSERQGYRAIEAGPARSTYSQSEGRPSLARSVSSKNPRASTIYEGTEFIPRSSGGSMYMDNNGRRASEGGSGGGSVYMDHNGRRASESSVYSSDREIPLRAIEYPPPLDESYEEGYDASTLISSFPDQSRAMMDHGNGSVYSSASTIKPSKANSHYSERQRSSPPSSHHGSSASSSRRSSHHHSTHRSPSSHRSTHSHSNHRSRSSEAGSHAPSSTSTRSARHVPLPDTGSSIASFATYRSGSHAPSSKAPSSKSYMSARDVPLPESMADLDLYDNDTAVTPDDSISQVDEGGRRPSYSHRSHTSRSGGGGGGGGGSRVSKHSSRFDEPVRPADSVSQISVNPSHVSKASSQRTMKAGGGGNSKAGSRFGGTTTGGSRRGSQVV
ncbi:hypothetical protein P168DRAFT_308019 [Aspergillus campestris IBT 28561]|uniref:VOC domain-containing protein n=1 Tax=Aspergillus campestris (strain IBT 28561) TaxID=1392248 RepID=A0A2I1DCZ5_ASPC2|nr:uncharacterized protein P168DRAFT_308019 [Aspergillus campestris IBT 28561]PKY07744.1 hypothetical protein P168DRAFT_308019 [Aspergillus campestris IBT 28561]